MGSLRSRHKNGRRKGLEGRKPTPSFLGTRVKGRGRRSNPTNHSGDGTRDPLGIFRSQRAGSSPPLDVRVGQSNRWPKHFEMASSTFARTRNLLRGTTTTGQRGCSARSLTSQHRSMGVMREQLQAASDPVSLTSSLMEIKFRILHTRAERTIRSRMPLPGGPEHGLKTFSQNFVEKMGGTHECNRVPTVWGSPRGFRSFQSMADGSMACSQSCSLACLLVGFITLVV